MSVTEDYTRDYTRFVNLRQSAFLKKLKNPLYRCPVLGESKFTNVQRIFDRVSQYQLKEVMYSGDQSPEELMLRVFIFDQFKTKHFWDYLKTRSYVPEIKTFNPGHLTTLIGEYSGEQKLFTTAYVVPGKAGESKAKTIADRSLQLIKSLKLDQGYTLADLELNNSSILFQTLTELPGIGDFLGSQVIFDLLWHESFKDYQPLFTLGVGAKRGAFKLGLISNINKVTSDDAEYALKTAKDALNQSSYPYARSLDQDVPLNFADIQNTFCEVDKWFRKIHPEISAGRSAPTNIKNKYRPGSPIEYKIPGWWVGAGGLVKLD
jgi:hypothetical protein